MNDKQKIHELYHKKTQKQFRIINANNYTYKKILTILNKHITPRMNLLDIGCGAGTISLYMANKGNKVLGIDISERAIRLCNASKEYLKLKNVSFEVKTFPKEIPNQKFDFVTFIEVIEHIDNPNLALNEIHKLLTKNGLLLLTTPSNNAPLFRWGLTIEFDKRVGHVKRFSISELRTMLKNNGFKTKEVYFTEGPLRNFLFVNPIAGKIIRFIKGPFESIFTYVDDISSKLFGESQFIILAQKK